jgi:hypothetical protein
MEIGQFKIVEPSITLDGLELENTALKNNQNTLIAIAVGTVVIGLFLYARYLKLKEQLKKNEIRMLKPEDVEQVV